MMKSALRLFTIAKPNRSKATLRAPMETMQSDSSAIFTRGIGKSPRLTTAKPGRRRFRNQEDGSSSACRFGMC
jgi:hypothetical protein